jgi:hypothetical protein
LAAVTFYHDAPISRKAHVRLASIPCPRIGRNSDRQKPKQKMRKFRGEKNSKILVFLETIRRSGHSNRRLHNLAANREFSDSLSILLRIKLVPLSVKSIAQRCMA